MSIPYEQIGRINQKSRTRQALLSAARELLARGVTATVELAAAHAGVSRPTAYRYFQNQRALLQASHPEIAMPSLLPDPAPRDVVERLDLVSEALTGLILDDELALRAMLRISLEGGATHGLLRTGRRIGWVTDALAPISAKLGAERFRNLVLRIAATLGIEVLVWLVDFAGVERKEAAELMRSNARDLLRAAL